MIMEISGAWFVHARPPLISQKKIIFLSLLQILIKRSFESRIELEQKNSFVRSAIAERTFILVASVIQCDRMARSLAQYFAIYNHEICPISKTILVQTIVNDKMAKSDSKFRQIL